MKLMRTAAALLLTALAAACGREPRAAAGGEPTVRDSAGVRIVNNGAAPTSGWRVGPEPRFIVGWESDGPMFTWVQSGRILSDGGALVGDFRTGSIYRIGPDGSVLGTWGRKGEGPGEYLSIAAILERGDSILISDGRLQRATLLSPDGEVLSTRALAGNFLHEASTILADGRLLLVPDDGYSAIGETRPEWVFETQPILAEHPEDARVDTLAELFHLRRWYGTRGASPGPIHVKGRAGGFADGFAWARSDEREVRWFDASGRLVQVARWDEEPALLTTEWRRRMTEMVGNSLRSRGAAGPFVQTQLKLLEEEMDRHEGPLPYWYSFHVDRLGNVWLSRYPPPGDLSEDWRVIARDGRFIGWVNLPGAIAILDITDDRILAVRQDEMNVQAVVMMDLIKGKRHRF